MKYEMFQGILWLTFEMEWADTKKDFLPFKEVHEQSWFSSKIVTYSRLPDSRENVASTQARTRFSYAVVFVFPIIWEPGTSL